MIEIVLILLVGVAIASGIWLAVHYLRGPNASPGPAPAADEERLRQRLERVTSRPTETSDTPPAKVATPARGGARPTTPATPQQPRPNFEISSGTSGAIHAKLSGLASDNDGKIVASHLQMVGLESIKEQLGDEWEQQSAKVILIADRVIQSHISGQDVYDRRGLGFVICFANADSQNATAKAKAIEYEIQEKILGENLDPGLAEIAAETRVLKVSASEAAESDDPMALITARIDEETNRIRNDLKAWSRATLATSEVHPNKVVTSTRTEAPFAILRFSQETLTEIERLGQIGADPAEIAAEVDCLKLRLAAEHAQRRGATDQGALIIDVNFSTINTKSFCSRYFEICRPVKEFTANSLILRIARVPSRGLGFRLLTIINKLKKFFLSLILKLDGLQPIKVDLRACQIPIVSVGYQDVTETATIKADELRRFSGELHDRKARILIDDVPDQDAGRLLLQGGADYLSYKVTNGNCPGLIPSNTRT